MIDTLLVRRLIETQFPQWKHLPIQPVAVSGWDNRTFHLGETMLVRMPSSADYALQVEKEQYWLPKLAPSLPLPIPVPLAQGKPAFDYPWNWSIYRWLPGESAATAPITDFCDLARSLAHFLMALEKIDTKKGPLPGLHSFYRGGALTTYDHETRQAIIALKDKINTDQALDLWENALATSWQGPPVWVHGDISAGNLLVQNGRLSAVIDFGQLTVGDPACDLSIAWTLFEGKSREVFRTTLAFDAGTWKRAQAWALWKALITAAGLIDTNNAEGAKCWWILQQLLYPT